MTSRQDEPVPGNERDDRFRFGQECPGACDADERPILLRIADLILGIEGRHPDEAPPAAGDLGHVLDGRGVHSTDREIQIDPTEDLESRRRLPARNANPAVGS